MVGSKSGSLMNAGTSKKSGSQGTEEEDGSDEGPAPNAT